MMIKIIDSPVFYRKKRKGLPGSNSQVNNTVNSYQYKDGSIQDLLFDIDRDLVKDGRNKLRFEVDINE